MRIYRQLIVAAYNSWRHDSEELKKQSANDFKNKILAQCLESALKAQQELISE